MATVRKSVVRVKEVPFTWMANRREAREVRAAAKARGVAVAAITRALMLGHFKVKMTPRVGGGPRWRETARRLAAVAKGVMSW